MIIETTEGWKDYELIDSGDGRRLERYGEFILDRPDPQIIWKKGLPETEWARTNAKYERETEDRGHWVKNGTMPDKWPIKRDGMNIQIKLTPFKHTGIFPEQSSQWDFIYKSIKESKREVNFLNLFAYTGLASLYAAKAGAQVTHVDASKPAVTWANENRDLNNMSDLPIRWIVDDVIKFTDREIKRGVKYDAIVMDPPVYGHGPTGKSWYFYDSFPKLLENCKNLISGNPLFININAYALSTSSITLFNCMQDVFGDIGGRIDNGELTIKESSRNRLLSTGIWSRWYKG